MLLLSHSFPVLYSGPCLVLVFCPCIPSWCGHNKPLSELCRDDPPASHPAVPERRLGVCCVPAPTLSTHRHLGRQQHLPPCLAATLMREYSETSKIVMRISNFVYDHETPQTINKMSLTEVLL